jgi:hypothetical protein
MSPRAALLLCGLLVACDKQPTTPPPPPGPAPPPPPPPRGADQALASADASPDGDMAGHDARIAPKLPEKAPDATPQPELPFEDPPMPEGVVWFNAYPGYTETSKIKVRTVQDQEIKSFPLYATTDTSSKQVGEVTYEHGELASWRKSRLIIDEPRMFVATRDLTISELFVADPHVPSHDTPHQDVKLKKGDKWLLYFFGEVGHCYVGLPKEKMLYGPCPEAPLFVNPSKPKNYIMPPLDPERAQWWLLVQRGDQVGWMQVDRRIFMTDPKY